jgi:hypothetical protein
MVRKPKLRLTTALILVFMSFGSAMGREFSLGLSGGVPFNDTTKGVNGLIAATGRYTVGPTAQIRLSRRFSFNIDLLYKQFDFGFVSESLRITAHRLEMPLLLQYDLNTNSIRPFVQAGIAFNRVIAVGGGNQCLSAGDGFYCIGGRTAAQIRHRQTPGPVVGAGINFNLGVVRLAPELRITRWIDRNIGTRDSPLRSNLTQIEMLVRVGF